MAGWSASSCEGRAAGEKFINALKMFYHVANIGDARSLAIHPPSTTHSQFTPEEQLKTGVSEGYVRLSVGIEHIDDIVATSIRRWRRREEGLRPRLEPAAAGVTAAQAAEPRLDVPTIRRPAAVRCSSSSVACGTASAISPRAPSASWSTMAASGSVQEVDPSQDRRGTRRCTPRGGRGTGDGSDLRVRKDQTAIGRVADKLRHHGLRPGGQIPCCGLYPG